MKISIVTISYNQGRFVEAAIRSIVEQRRDGCDVEYVFVDAGSTDETLAILDRYKEEIDHLIVEPDDGPADGLNKGFAADNRRRAGFHKRG